MHVYSYLPQVVSDMILRGQGGPRSIFPFCLFLIEENVSCQELLWNEKILLLAEVIAISNLKNTYNYIIRARTLITIPRKSTLSLNSSYSFWGNPLKQGSYLLGIKTKTLTCQIFDLGLRSENIQFWKSLVAYFHQIRGRFSHFWLFLIEGNAS